MLWKYCKNIVDVAPFFFLIPPQISATTILFFFFSSHFWQLGCHNSYFLSPQFPTISTTWLPQLVNLIRALPLEHFTGSAWAMEWISIIPLPKFIFSPSLSHHSTFYSKQYPSIDWYRNISLYYFFFREFQPMVSAFNDSSIIRLRN